MTAAHFLHIDIFRSQADKKNVSVVLLTNIRVHLDFNLYTGRDTGSFQYAAVSGAVSDKLR